MEKRKNKALIPITALLLLVSFAASLTVAYARSAARGGETAWGYLIIRGVLVSVFCGVLFWLGSKYAVGWIEKYHKPVLCIGTGVQFVFFVLKSFLATVEQPVLARLIEFVYAALPFLSVITLCALIKCLETVLGEALSVKNIGFIAVGILCAAVSGNVLKFVLLILLIGMLTGQFKAKTGKSKAPAIILCAASVCLTAYLVSEGIAGVQYYLKEWHNPLFMTQVSQSVWGQAKAFGAMEDMSIAGGNTHYFGVLWLVAFLGIVPTVVILLALAVLTVWLLKQKKAPGALSQLSKLVIVYLAVRTVFAVLQSGGVFLHAFMTPVPLAADTAAGMCSVFLLLGVFGQSGHPKPEKAESAAQSFA